MQLPVIQEKSDDELEHSAYKLLPPKQQRFVHLYLSGAYTIPEIAELLNVSPSAVRKWLYKTEVKELIKVLQQEEDEIVKQSLKALRLRAMYKMADLLNSKVDGIAWQAAKDILDRTGHKPASEKKVNVGGTVTFEQQIRQLAAEIEEDAIDVKFEEIDDE